MLSFPIQQHKIYISTYFGPVTSISIINRVTNPQVALAATFYTLYPSACRNIQVRISYSMGLPGMDESRQH